MTNPHAVNDLCPFDRFMHKHQLELETNDIKAMGPIYKMHKIHIFDNVLIF